MNEELQRVVMQDSQYLTNLTNRSTWALLRILDGVNDTLAVTSWLRVREQYRLRQARNVLMHTIDRRITEAKNFLRDRTMVNLSGHLVKKSIRGLQWHEQAEINRAFDNFCALVWYKTFYPGVWL